MSVALRQSDAAQRRADTLWSAILALAAGEPIEDQAVALAAMGVDTSPLVALRDRLAMAPPPPPALRPDDPIVALELSQRASGCLLRAYVTQIRDLTKQTAADLLKIRGCGLTTLDEIRAALARHGLALKGDDAAPRQTRVSGAAYVLHVRPQPLDLGDHLGALRGRVLRVLP